MSGPRVAVSAKEAKERRMMLADAMSNGLSFDEITEVMFTHFGMNTDQVKALMDKVKRQLQTEFDENSALHRATASRRIHRHIIEARKKGQFSAVANLEGQLARIQGTEAHQQVQINADIKMQGAVVQLLGSLTQAQLNELVAEELQHFKQLPSDSRSPVITTGESVPAREDIE
jgi:hypothetical protein